MPSKHVSSPGKTLRARAEAKSTPGESGQTPLSASAAAALVHELQVHQIELEMQNDELRRAALSLDAARERYFDLYDLAPVGYLTLSEKGLITECNLAAAGLLGQPRGQLVQQPLSRFFLPEDAGTYFEHRRYLLSRGEPQACDLQLVTQGGAVSWVRLEMTTAKGEDGKTQIRAALSDISKRKLAERLLADKAKSLEAALAKMETLVNLLPICASCAKIRSESGQWLTMEEYVAQHPGTGLAHGLCGECEKLG